MTKQNIDITADMPSSTSNGVSKKDLKRLVKQSIQQQPKQIQNSVYGQSAVTKQSRENFKKHVEEALQDYDRVEEIDGRDYRKMREPLQDALYHVRNEGGHREEYTWYINPDTLNLIRDLYDFFSRLNRGITTDSSLEMHGVPFYQAANVPEGWVLLANKDKVKNGHPYPHPMALIREMDAGFQECIEMAIGGEMNFRVINA